MMSFISSRFVGPVVPGSSVKFGDPRLNLSRKLHLKASEAAFSMAFPDNFRAEVVSDVISAMITEPTGVKVRVKFGDCRSNRSRDIRLPHFVTNDDHAGERRSSHKRKTPLSETQESSS